MSQYPIFIVKDAPDAVMAEQVKLRAKALLPLLPETWTHKTNIGRDQARIGFNFKLIGLDWRSDADYLRIFHGMWNAGLLLMDGDLIRRNHNFKLD